MFCHFKRRVFSIRFYVLIICFLMLVFIILKDIHIGFHQWVTRPILALPRRSMFTAEMPANRARLPLIYIITPTVYRVERKADLTRLSQTLRLVPRIHWIVVEDKETKTSVVSNLLNRTKLNFTHLATTTLNAYRNNKAHHQRNVALDWLAEHTEFPSVVYFADDDNTYDIRLFEEMRFTKKVSVWPVGLISRAMFQTPVVRNGKVIGFALGYTFGRRYPIDMAGFAINSDMLKGPNPARFRNTTKKGFLESDFLDELNITYAELEPKADNCTKVLVWHTRTEKTKLNSAKNLKEMLKMYKLPELEV